jgi:cellulose synthase/poly-beta-1,6-N-acetylglucosamine synthase-like glycosyltransferase
MRKTFTEAIDFNERLIGTASLAILFTYVALYGIIISNGFHIDNLSDYRYFWIYVAIIPILFTVDGIKSLLESTSKPKYLYGKEDLSQVSVIIPTYNGANTIGSVIKDLLKRFNAENIIISSNGSTDDSIKIAKEFGVITIDTKKPIGKVKAINVALDKVKTPYTLLLDDDTVVGDTNLPTELLEKYDAIAFMVLPFKGNWITTIQEHEYAKSMQIGKVFHNNGGTVQNISGAIGLFHTKELIRQIELHTGEFSGEDLQRTLLIHLNEDDKRGEGVIVSESVVRTSVPDTIVSLFNQRVYGWMPGLNTNLGNYLRVLFKNNAPKTLRYDAFYSIFLVTLMDIPRLLFLPVILFYPIYFVVMYVCYVALELCYYVKLKDKAPAWVILVYPFYGLFNFITRVCAFTVFIYRRIVTQLKNAEDLDDYKQAGLHQKIIGYVVPMGILIIFLTAYLRKWI